jgi:hypothetical protein
MLLLKLMQNSRFFCGNIYNWTTCNYINKYCYHHELQSCCQWWNVDWGLQTNVYIILSVYWWGKRALIIQCGILVPIIMGTTHCTTGQKFSWYVWNIFKYSLLIARWWRQLTTSEMPVNFYHTTQRNIPEGSHLHHVISLET